MLPFPMVPELMVWRFDVSTLVTSVGLIGLYGAGYSVITALMGVPQAGAVLRRVLRRK